MVNRVLPLVLAALAIALFVSAPALAEAEKNSHTGTVVSFDGKTLKMKGKDNKEHEHAISDTTELMVDGKKSDAATFKSLKEGTKIRVWLDKNDSKKVIKVEALDKNTDFGK